MLACDFFHVDGAVTRVGRCRRETHYVGGRAGLVDVNIGLCSIGAMTLERAVEQLDRKQQRQRRTRRDRHCEHAQLWRRRDVGTQRKHDAEYERQPCLPAPATRVLPSTVRPSRWSTIRLRSVARSRQSSRPRRSEVGTRARADTRRTPLRARPELCRRIAPTASDPRGWLSSSCITASATTAARNLDGGGNLQFTAGEGVCRWCTRRAWGHDLRVRRVRGKPLTTSRSWCFLEGRSPRPQPGRCAPGLPLRVIAPLDPFHFGVAAAVRSDRTR